VPEPAQPMAGAVDGLPGRLGQVVERWSPVGLRNARTDPGRRGAVALVAVALLAALAVGAHVWHGRPQAQPVAPPPVGAGVAPPGSAPPGPPGPAASTGSLVVAVTGKVRRPGVVTVLPGARVIDVVKAAGGTLPGADLAMLNLARKVADGELVAVGVPGPAPGAGDPGAPAAGGDAAAPAELDTLPGVGPVLAQRILDWRTAHGQFAAVDQLSDVPGIGDARMAQLRDLVRV
jgi:competence protein ComEA